MFKAKKTRRRRIKKQRVEPLPSREKSPDRQKMKMGDLLQWNPQHNFLPKKAKKKVAPLKSVEPICASDSYVTIEEDNEEESNQSASLPAPQVMIGPDGNIVLNTESLIIPSTQNEGKRSKEIIEEDDNDKYLNTNSYRSAKKAKAWTDKETEKFFLGLSMCGTDFSLLTNLLTHRSRRDLKNKFRREEKRNRPLIDKALADRQKYNPTPFEKIAEEVEAKAKPLVKKRMKKEMGQTVERSAGVKAAKSRKKQKKDPDDEEEGDWDPEEDEENMCVEKETVAMAQTPTTKKRGQMVKAEVNPATSLPSASIAAASPVQKRGRARVIPATSTAPDVDHQSDLDSLRMSARPKKTYAGWKPQTSGSQLAPTNMATTLGGTGNNQSNNRDSGIPAIPGFSQIQIQMEGVQDLVPGVLIPSHIVPTIAPRLGIENPEEGMQVLLAQEETPSGSIVHVYIIPEAEGETTVPGRTEEPADIASQLMTTTVPNPHPKASQTAPQNLAVPSAESNTINKSSNSLASTLAQSSASLYSLPATTSNIHSSSPSTTQAGVRSHPYTDSNPSQDHVQPQLPKQELAMVHTETNTLCSLPDSMNLTLPQNGHTASSSHTVDGTTTCPPIQARCTVIDQPFGNVEAKEQISQPSIKISTNTTSDTSVGSNSKVATL